MKFNRIDIAEAHIAYGALYHKGQSSEAYRNLCRGQVILEKCGTRKFVEPQDLSENGLSIYQELGGKIEEKPCQDCGRNTNQQPCSSCVADYSALWDSLES